MTFLSVDDCLSRFEELARAGSESSLDEQAWLLYSARYYAYIDALAVGGARSVAETIALLQELVPMAALLGDPKGIGPLASAQLELLQRASLNKNDAQLRAAICEFTTIVISVDPSASSVELLREQLEGFEEQARDEASRKIALDEIAEMESRLARRDQMTPAEQMRLHADFVEMDRRLSWEERAKRNWAAAKAPQHAGFRCWRRPGRRAARCPARRCSARRATCDAGGAGDSDGDGPGDGRGPRFRGSLLRAYGVAPVRGPGGRGVKPRPHARGSEPPAPGLGIACGRGPYPSAVRACAALWRRRFQGPPRGPVRAADGGGQHGCEA